MAGTSEGADPAVQKIITMYETASPEVKGLLQPAIEAIWAHEPDVDGTPFEAFLEQLQNQRLSQQVTRSRGESRAW